MPRDSDSASFARCVRLGDHTAVAAALENAAEDVRAVAERIVGRGAAADDLVQATYLAALEGADRLRPGRPLRPWLVGIVRKLGALAHRRARRPLDVGRLRSPAARDPVQAAAACELTAIVDNALAQVPPAYGPVLSLYLGHGLGAAEIARALGRRKGTVRTQLVRGLEHLRRNLPPGIGVLALVCALGRGARAASRAETGAGSTAASFGVLSGGILLMKKVVAVVVAAIAALLLLSWPGAKAPPQVEPQPVADAPAQASPAATAPDSTPHREDAAGLAPASGERSAWLAVRVVAESGARPLPGVGVDLVPCNGLPLLQQIRGQTTDADGRATWSGLEPGTWSIAVWSMDEAKGEARRSIELGAGERAEVTLTATPAWSVEGIVLDALDAPVPNARVWVTTAPHSDRARTHPVAMTAADGTFTADGLGREQWIFARKDRFAASPHANVAAGDARQRVTLRLGAAGATLRGVVLHAGTAVAGARLTLVRPPTNPHSRGGVRLRDHGPEVHEAGADGTFALAGLLPGPVDLHVEALTLRPSRHRLTLTAGGVHEVVIELEDGAVLRGTVRSRAGDPIAGASVTARAGGGERATLTRADGRFELVGLAPGPTAVAATARGFCGAESRLHTATAAAALCDLTLWPQAILHGRVVDENGAGLPGFTVSARPARLPRGSWSRRTDALGRVDSVGLPRVPCDEDGRFTLNLMPDDDYLLEAHEEGAWLGIERPGTVRGDGEEEVLLTVPLDRRATAHLRGRAVDADGTPVADAWLQVGDGRKLGTVGRSTGGTPQTRADGTFEIGPLVPGEYVVVVHPRQGLPQHRTSPITLGVREERDLGDVVVAAGGTVRVSAHWSDGKPLAGASVQADVLPAGPWQVFRTDATGNAIRALAPGRYRITLFGEGFRWQRHEVELTGGTTLPLELVVVPAVRRRITVTFPEGVRAATLTLRAVDGQVDATLEVDPGSPFPNAWSPHLIAGAYTAELAAPDGRRFTTRFLVPSLEPSEEPLAVRF